MLLTVDGHRSLFTADAGIPALTQVIELCDNAGIDLSQTHFIQVPHHGSKRNIGPAILDRIVGPRLNTDERIKTALVSVAVNGEPKHPSKKVTNAFRRRGARPFATKGGNRLHSHNAPGRNWPGATPIPFYNQVEE